MNDGFWKIHGYSCGIVAHEDLRTSGRGVYLYHVGHPEQAIGSWPTLEVAERWIGEGSPNAEHWDYCEWDGCKWVTTKEVRPLMI